MENKNIPSTNDLIAKEICNLAANSASSVDDIKRILQTIQKETKNVADIITETSKLGKQLAAATEEIGASMQLLASTAKKIKEMPGVVNPI